MSKKVRALAISPAGGGRWLINPKLPIDWLPGWKVFVGDEIPKDLPQGSLSYWAWSETTQKVVVVDPKPIAEVAPAAPVPPVAVRPPAPPIKPPCFDDKIEEVIAKLRHEMKSLHNQAIESSQFSLAEVMRSLRRSDRIIVGVGVTMAMVMFAALLIVTLHG